jgi:hypothetical protein
MHWRLCGGQIVLHSARLKKENIMAASQASQNQPNASVYAEPSRASGVYPSSSKRSGAEHAPVLSTLTYQSRAVSPFTEIELHALLEPAQARNRALDITGLLIYDNGRFFQCLEGPAAALDTVWASIQRDPRHADVELLGNAQTRTRFFSHWSMQLAQPDGAANAVYTDSMYVAPAVVELLYRTPEAAPSILAMLAPPRALGGALPPDQHDLDRAALTEVVRRVVVPQLAAAHGLAPRIDAIDTIGTIDTSEQRAHALEITQLSQLSQLPRLLLAAEPSRAFKLIADAYAERRSLGELCALLLEPTARSLGDLWQSDECSELDVTLGLCRMQTAIRRLDLSESGVAVSVANPHTALLATQPGEPHMLDATTNAEMLWQAGWDTRVEFPATDAALQALVADTWFDSLDLSMSPSFCREDWRERLKVTIAAARKSSKNPAIAIVISGRLAFDHADTAASVGADRGSRTALHIESVMLEALRHGGGDD